MAINAWDFFSVWIGWLMGTAICYLALGFSRETAFASVIFPTVFCVALWVRVATKKEDAQ